MARPTFDAANTGTYTVSVTPGTANMAFGSMVEIGASPPDDVTWGGNTMTSIVTGATNTGGTERRGRLARYTPVGSGAQTVSTTDPDALGGVLQRMGLTLDGVDTTTPIAASGSANGSGTSVSVSVGTVTADQLVVWALHTATNGTQSVTDGANTTTRAQGSTPDNNPRAIGTATGDVTLTWSATQDWVLLYAVVNGTPEASATPALGRWRIVRP